MIPSVRFTLGRCLLLTVGALLPFSGNAAILFDFTFADPTGQGLNDPNNAQARASVVDAGVRLGSFFVNTGTVTIVVNSENNANSTTLASAGSSIFSSGPGFYRNVVQTKILEGIDQNGVNPDGEATINLGSNFEFDPAATVASDKIDFTSTFIHELTHALGFSSNFSSTPNTTTGGVYSIFDMFLSDSQGNFLIDRNTFIFDAGKVGTLTGGNNTLQPNPSSTGEFFAGDNAKLALNGQLAPIFSPSPYQEGSSGSHTDDNTQFTAGQLMNAATVAGPGARSYSALEMGIMQDIGYTLVPEPGTFGLLAFGALFLGFRRRTGRA